MTFKAKLRRIGNSLGVLIPKNVITSYKERDIIELEVITKEDKQAITPDLVITKKEGKPMKVITENFNTGWCSKHDSMKGSCGCK